MSPPPDVRAFDTLDAAALALAEHVRALSAEAVVARGRFAVALSGGTTPAALYLRLASPPFAAAIDWPRWVVLWGDERCVPPEHPDSNYGMAHRELLSRVPVAPAQVHRIRGEATPEDAADEYARVLRDALAPDGRLDLALLGVGADGHTASLFPGAAALAVADRDVAAVQAPGDGGRRVTLTLPALNRARHVALLAHGADKSNALRQALSPRPSDATPPVALVSPMDGAVRWYVTRGALGGVGGAT